jgi:hypothetical protein
MFLMSAALGLILKRYRKLSPGGNPSHSFHSKLFNIFSSESLKVSFETPNERLICEGKT